MRLNAGIFFAGLLLVCSITATTIQAQVSTTFDSSLEGWWVTGDNGASFDALHGIPAGCLSVNDLAFGPINYAVAPKVYHGDWLHLTASDYLSVDIFHSSSDPDDIPAAYIFRIAGPGGAAQRGPLLRRGSPAQRPGFYRERCRGVGCPTTWGRFRKVTTPSPRFRKVPSYSPLHIKARGDISETAAKACQGTNRKQWAGRVTFRE